MHVRRTLWLACVVIAGCAGSTSTKPTLVGTWTTSTAPELADSAETWIFLESGEYQRKFVVKLPGMVHAESGKPFPPTLVTGSGTWKFEGDKLHLHCTQCSVREITFDPEDWRVKEITATTLVIEKDGKVVTFFRVKE